MYFPTASLNINTPYNKLALMIHLKRITILTIVVMFSLACSSRKNDYPADITQNFMNSCQESGSDQATCACLLEKIQEKYTFEEFSSIEVKMQAGHTPEDFLDFVGKARAQCKK